MKITVGDKSFEYTVNGKSLEGEADIFEAFVALGSAFFPFAVVTRSDEAVRAVTFAIDEKYSNELVERREPVLAADEEIGLLGLEQDNEGLDD
jgi:hypothetical protein